MLYFLHNTLVLSFDIDVVLTCSSRCLIILDLKWRSVGFVDDKNFPEIRWIMVQIPEFYSLGFSQQCVRIILGNGVWPNRWQVIISSNAEYV